MATLQRFKINPAELQNVIQEKLYQAELTKRLHFIAARKIQAWFRGIVTRAHFCKLHECATTVQRHWRGYRTRILVKHYFLEYVHQMWQNYYNSMATRIQAVWRGYWARKTGINFVQQRRWLKAVYAKNDEVLENMKKYRQAEFESMESAAERESLLRILFILFKLHHLLRTECRPGVITRIDKTRFTYIEEMLKCLRYKRYVPRAKFLCRDRKIDRGSPSISHDVYLEKCKREMRELEESLRSVSVSRSTGDYSAEESNKTITRNEYSIGGRSNKFSDECSRWSFAPTELHEAIDRMDCRLDRLCLRCPIHNSVL